MKNYIHRWAEHKENVLGAGHANRIINLDLPGMMLNLQVPVVSAKVMLVLLAAHAEGKSGTSEFDTSLWSFLPWL